MYFSRRDQFYQASRITGPPHNFLAISFGDHHDAAAPTIEASPLLGACRHVLIDPQRILLAVMNGVNMANTQFNVQFTVQHVRYMENDTEPEQIPGVMAIKLVAHLLAGGGTFDSLAPQRITRSRSAW